MHTCYKYLSLKSMHNVHECAMCVDDFFFKSMAHVGTQFGGVHIYIYVYIYM